MLAALLLSLSLSGPGSVPPPPGQAAVPPSTATVALRGGGYYGSGVVWDPAAGLVLTALHVVEDMPDIEATLPGGAERRAVVVDRDPALDLALVRLEGGAAGVPAAHRASHPPAAGALVRLRGCPRDRCDGEVLGAVLAPLWRFAGGDYLRIAAPVEPGASGGPVLDAEGAVVGIVDLALLSPGGVALAVPIAAAERRFGGGAVALAGARK